MYKVFINEKSLILTNLAGVEDAWRDDPNTLITLYPGKAKFLFNYIDALEKEGQYDRIVVYTDDPPQLWKDFKSLYKRIDAAGGLVTNEKGWALVIFRRQFWDLPKGKIDKGESPEEAAIREVQEETGLNKVTIVTPITNTYHTYMLKGQRILKKTYWFKMVTDETKLTPQLAEDIDSAVWVDLDVFLATKPLIYKSILEVLSAFSK